MESMKKDNKLTVKGKNKQENNKKDSKIVENKTIRDVQEFKKSETRILTKRQLLMVREVAQLIITLPNKLAVADQLHITERALYKRFSQYPEIQQYVDILKQELVNYAKNKLVNHLPIAADNIVKLANEAISENVKLEANKEILDRAGLAKQTTNNNIQVNVMNSISKDKDNYTLD
jgi:hypothetical protein